MSLSLLLVVVQCAAAVDGDLTSVREHFSRGRYAEAQETLESLPSELKSTPEAMLVESRLQSTLGQTAEALKTLSQGIEAHPQQASLLAEKSRILFQQGELEASAAATNAALAIDRDQPLARLVQADVWTATGDLRRASDGYRWFVRYYNQAQPTDAETLLIIGRGAAQYARWRSASQIFSFIVNTVCADALAADPNCWEARQLAGQLLLEKYNRAEGIPELQAALAINPQAPELLVTLAEAELDELQHDPALELTSKALATNPRHPDALRVRARAFLSQGNIIDAERVINESLAVCPTDQRALAVAAFVELQKGDQVSLERMQELFRSLESIDKWTLNDSPFEALVVRLAKTNPHPGYFLQDLGQFFQGQRNFPYAEACYAQAIASMPQLSQPKSDLGMLLFQAGRNEEARKYLDDAFQADPYHVRISNMRKVLKVLDDYAVVSTPHFVIRADSQLDGVLARYMAEELEAVYASVTGEYGFEPPQRTQIEVYNNSKGLAGHQWFSARMIGLPWLQTIGASTGLMIALTSPAATKEPFNWARVLRHEFVHVVTLQQTGFNIPHWFTEALATRSEGYPHPEAWDDLLIRRFESGQLKNLDNLHLGFQRAESREDWDFAYCQSVLYAEYFVERFGEDALPKLLNAYRDNRSTDVALKMAYGVEKADVEAGYLDYLKRRVAELKANHSSADFDEEQVKAAYEADPTALVHRARYAQLQLRLRKLDDAESLASKVLDDDPTDVTAATVLAQIKMLRDDIPAAIEILQRADHPERVNRRLKLLLGQLLLKAGQSSPALALFQQAGELWPREVIWQRGLAEASESLEQGEPLKSALEAISRLDGESVEARLKRAEIALDENDFETAVKYAKLALHIDVLDVEIHLTLARGFAGLNQTEQAITEYDVALQLQPGDKDIEAERAALMK